MKDTTYAIYHPVTNSFMCNIIIKKDDTNFNKAQVNEPGTKNYNPIFPKWIKVS